MVDWTDSFYQYVKARVLAINPTRVFSGIVDATDWPSLNAIPDSFYLILNSLDPNRGQGPGTNSWFAPLFGESVMWSWPIIGADIGPDTIAANRGSRYRTNFHMIQEILQGMYPGFCEMKQWSMEGTTLISASYTPPEFIYYTKPKFSTRIERSTGILFGAASVTITGFSPILS
jgi:hypothetical protein